MKPVDVIIPLYNKERTILRAVRSVLHQTYPHWRLIVVDDGSTDHGAQRVQQMNDSRIFLIRQDNQGPGAARNRGIEAAQAPYIAFLDADDQWYPDYLQNGIAALESRPTASFAGTMYEEWPRQIEMTGYWLRRGVYPGFYRLTGREPAPLAEALMMFFHVGTTILRTDIARKYGGFYTENKCTFGEDTVFFARLVFNEPFLILPRVCVRHNRQDSSLSHSVSGAVAPILRNPSLLLDWCPPEKKKLAEDVLCYLALRTAHHQARNGFRKTAAELLERFPDARRFKGLYQFCRLQIAFSPLLKYWVLFKRFGGLYIRPPIQRFWRKLTRKPIRDPEQTREPL
ncbi:MAG TPA: glycosyltransferase [Anaerohalosphaeraceae bacterium]|nr:glycosyltransferase [Anaerohalosphaeraceae bacterium]